MAKPLPTKLGLPSPYYTDDWVTLYHADAEGFTLACDVLVTDPPFNVGKDYGESKDNRSAADFAALIGGIIATGPERQGWVAPNIHFAAMLGWLGSDAHPVVVRRGAHGPKRWGWYDQFDLLLVRGEPRRCVANLWDDIRLKGEGYFFREQTHGHPGYTPYPILSRLVSLLAGPGETVLDPFAGTGTTLVAAKAAGCKAIGIELDERWCEIAAQRCAQEVLDLEAA